MFLFGKNKLKIKSKEREGRAQTFIEYYDIKEKEAFKEKVLKELMSNNLCLGVISSKLLYLDKTKDSKETFDEIIDKLESAKITYKKIEIRKNSEVAMFGLTVKKGSDKKHKDYIVGFVVNKDNFNMIEKYINNLNMYYFIDNTGLSEEDFFHNLGKNYEDLDEIGKDFYLEIFDNTFINKLVISSKIELAREIKEIANKCYSELN
ncbi:hypothetical protein [Clostridium sp. C2-6-12]|uniref:hypothetical protein n=1 Tax=Clostridium sp. C2-6-12 TaxID=2698832 RepID=UPI00136FE02D|nr:hypothetical protein [Clostridium sp. C2-6-12]